MIFTEPGAAPTPGPEYLCATPFMDTGAAPVRAFAERTVAGESTRIGKAVRLFYAVRDSIRYDPFSMRLDPATYAASHVLATGFAYCLPKAILLAAAARVAGIPAAIGLSDVVNHLVTEKLKDRLGGKTYFMHHGYAVLYLEGAWVKAAPAFNIELCDRFGVRPTEFDGRSNAILQEYDARDRRHMEYVKDHGVWSDFPYEKVATDFRAFYPPVAFRDDAAGERFEDGKRLH
ncbi:MAG: transglutaminase family protein [Gammaproteobacteria bacterium]|nr:transglutaminase family protein [Gammaproteobacteria bacterium]